jgi:hypothetical protein
MKKIYFWTLLLVTLFSCNSKKEYTLKGTFSDKIFNGKEIYLNKYDRLGTLSSDTAIISNNRFKFKGEQEEPAVYYLLMDDEAAYGEIALGSMLLIKPGNITVNIVDDRVYIGGNEENEIYQAYLDKQYPLTEILLKYQNQVDSIINKNIDKINIYSKYIETLDQLRDLTLEYLLNNINNRLGEEVFINSFQMFEYSDIKKILSFANESFVRGPEVTEIMAEFEANGNF